MSARYGISLILEPPVTAGLHRARQVVCSQYGCWAAEMHSVHLPLTDYFPCPEEEAPSLAAALEKVSDDFQREYSDAFVIRAETLAESQENGSIYVPFASGSNSFTESRPSDLLQAEVTEVLGSLNLSVGGKLLPLHFALLQYSGLTGRVFRSAVRFAEGVINGLQLPRQVGLSELALFRYDSASAGEDWVNGSWATDLSWQMIGAYPLSGHDEEQAS